MRFDGLRSNTPDVVGFLTDVVDGMPAGNSGVVECLQKSSIKNRRCFIVNTKHTDDRNQQGDMELFQCGHARFGKRSHAPFCSENEWAESLVRGTQIIQEPN